MKHTTGSRNAMIGSQSVATIVALVLLAFGGMSADAAEPVCSRPDVILCEGWENGHAGWGWNSYWQPDDQGGVKCGSSLESSGTTAAEGDCALALHFDENESDALYPDRNIPPQSGIVHARFMIKYSDNFQWNAPGAKVFYLRSNADDSYSWSAQLGSRPADPGNLTGPGVFYMDLQSHNLQLPYNTGEPGDGLVIPGQWHSVEMMARSQSLPGSRGAVKVWVDGKLVMDYPDVDMLNHAVDPTTMINMIWISAYIGGPTDPHPAQSIWYDAIVTGTQYIGPPEGFVAGEPPDDTVGSGPLPAPDDVYRTDTTE